MQNDLDPKGLEAALDARVGGACSVMEHLDFTAEDAKLMGVHVEGENFAALDVVRHEQWREAGRQVISTAIRAYLSATVPAGDGELPAGSLRGVVPHSIRVAAEDLANEVWSDLDEIRTKTRLTDAWGVIAEACGDDIIRFAAGISPALAASRLSQAMVWPDKPTPAMRDALRIGSRADVPSDELCNIRYAALKAALSGDTL